MPKNCSNHAHGHSHGKKADKWTNVNSVLNLPTSFINNQGVWTNTAYNTIRTVAFLLNDDPSNSNLLYAALCVAGLMSIYAAVGDTICHRYMNKQLQVQPHHDEHTLLQKDSAQSEWSTPKKLFFLGGDAISHIADTAGPMAYLTMLLAELLFQPKATLTNLLLRLIFSFFIVAVGIAASVAPVRGCANLMFKRVNCESDSDVGHTINHQI